MEWLKKYNIFLAASQFYLILFFSIGEEDLITKVIFAIIFLCSVSMALVIRLLGPLEDIKQERTTRRLIWLLMVILIIYFLYFGGQLLAN